MFVLSGQKHNFNIRSPPNVWYCHHSIQMLKLCFCPERTNIRQEKILTGCQCPFFPILSDHPAVRSSKQLLQSQKHGNQHQQQDNADDSHQNTRQHQVPDHDHAHTNTQHQSGKHTVQDLTGNFPVDFDLPTGTDPDHDGLNQQRHKANCGTDHTNTEGIPFRQQA